MSVFYARFPSTNGRGYFCDGVLIHGDHVGCDCAYEIIRPAVFSQGCDAMETASKMIRYYRAYGEDIKGNKSLSKLLDIIRDYLRAEEEYREQ